MKDTNSKRRAIYKLWEKGERSTLRPFLIGVWPSGKAAVFGTVHRRFESFHPRSLFLSRPPVLLFSFWSF